MKNSKNLMVGLLAAGFMAATNSQGMAGQAMPTGPVKLKLDWPVGRHATEAIDMTMKSEIAIPGTPQPMAQDMTMDMDSALAVSADPAGGNRDLELQYTSAKFSVAMNGNSLMTFDSAAPPSADANPAAAAFGKIIGCKVVFVLAPDNHVEGVRGIEAIEQVMAPADPSGMMKGMFSSDALKQQVDFSKYLPAKPVQPGDSWAAQMDFPMGTMGTMVMNYNFTLISWEKLNDHWCAKLAENGTIHSKSGASSEMPGMKGMKMNIHGGTCTGEMWFDLDAGMFVKFKLQQDMKLDMTMPNPMGQQPNAPADITMQDTTHQIIDTTFHIK